MSSRVDRLRKVLLRAFENLMQPDAMKHSFQFLFHGWVWWDRFAPPEFENVCV